jgi:hypothetical protein
MGVLAWKIGGVKMDGAPILSTNVLYTIYAILALIYIVHVIKVLQVNLPY